MEGGWNRPGDAGRRDRPRMCAGLLPRRPLARAGRDVTAAGSGADGRDLAGPGPQRRRIRAGRQASRSCSDRAGAHHNASRSATEATESRRALARDAADQQHRRRARSVLAASPPRSGIAAPPPCAPRSPSPRGSRERKGASQFRCRANRGGCALRRLSAHPAPGRPASASARIGRAAHPRRDRALPRGRRRRFGRPARSQAALGLRP